uniref:ApaG domain-containing protein n=1 Tax=Aureoumbra lagunensis TaxID=44058 RepID=A0A7S3K4D2_9STRA|mmetsp:Transcript_20358/g.26390  ORF Transcript_20358/g.26390 Transcript_20358/m.26390 type:complete len:272 (+) Transcript_20358:34-849(+)|eukprot:CAMPEP_0197294086 /NCGR_PEP_ID=MMETSP0890-20130614/30992_1 /TAXON_ID=44058 ORGANISM="Aureoumbra lagunensis, Strain CCMP1510" /NCGR_SAMPLE_ID=MMETSP0890 /ASSEMBLY_ACC=CAM_ASM_000533 /LENGTH=271 /DNA_ID=CAMNT_0042769247 /DNA_START=18 /DNA_END=833 /DNA_ORIENTATION=+
MTTGTGGNGLVVRALYRASLRAIKSLGDRSLPMQWPIRAHDWGKHRRLDTKELEKARESMFPWSIGYPLNEIGELEQETLLKIVRERFRDTTRDDYELALDEGFRALQNFHSLAAQLQVSSVCETKGIYVQAMSRFLGINSATNAYIFAYRIRVSNVGGIDTVQLRSRHWIIQDTNGGSVVIPRGSPGVVGQTPTLAPGEIFEYVSGSELNAPTGTIQGSFNLFIEGDDDLSQKGEEQTTNSFEANINPFQLRADHIHALNRISDISGEER